MSMVNFMLGQVQHKKKFNNLRPDEVEREMSNAESVSSQQQQKIIAMKTVVHHHSHTWFIQASLSKIQGLLNDSPTVFKD